MSFCSGKRRSNQIIGSEPLRQEIGERYDMIKRADIEDADVLTALAIRMWTDNDPDELAEEFRQLIKREDAACFLKFIDDRPIAFAQCQLRHDYVEGTDSSPVGYLEGVFVSEGYRRNGYAAQLLAACEKWAKEKGCTEFASDCELANADSQRFHLAVGFAETNRIIEASKELLRETGENELNDFNKTLNTEFSAAADCGYVYYKDGNDDHSFIGNGCAFVEHDGKWYLSYTTIMNAELITYLDIY